MKWILVLALMGAGPASKPATAPTDIDLKPIEQRLSLAKQTADRAKFDARQKWEASDEYAKLKADVDEKRSVLEKARAGDDAKAKLDASAVYNTARLKLEAEDRKRTATPTEDAAAQLASRELDDAKRENASRAQAKRDSDPIVKAIREHTLLKGMTKEQVLSVFPYTDQTIQREDGEVVTFIDDEALPRRATVTFVEGRVVAFRIETRALSDFKPTPGKP